MTPDDPKRWEETSHPSNAMPADDRRAVDEQSSNSAKIVHEVVRLQGDEELGRPIRSLMFSGFAAGVAISTSLIAEASIRMRLPDAPWRDLIVSLGYTVGFIVVILGKMQLFTEATVTAVLPVATHPSLQNFGRLIRIWLVVFIANMAGTFFVALLMSSNLIVEPALGQSLIELSGALLSHSFGETLLLATPAGFLIASIAWILPNARGNEIWVIFVITYIVSLAGFAHVVAGSGEVWTLYLAGQTTLGGALFGIILPTLLGNIVGGSGLFAVLAHGQVRDEIK